MRRGGLSSRDRVAGDVLPIWIAVGAVLITFVLWIATRRNERKAEPVAQPVPEQAEAGGQPSNSAAANSRRETDHSSTGGPSEPHFPLDPSHNADSNEPVSPQTDRERLLSNSPFGKSSTAAASRPTKGDRVAATHWQGELIDIRQQEDELHLLVQSRGSTGSRSAEFFVANAGSMLVDLSDYRSRFEASADGDNVTASGTKRPEGSASFRLGSKELPLFQLQELIRDGEPGSKVVVGERRDPSSFRSIRALSAIEEALRNYPTAGNSIVFDAVFLKRSPAGMVDVATGYGWQHIDKQRVQEVDFSGFTGEEFSQLARAAAVHIEAFVTAETTGERLRLRGVSIASSAWHPPVEVVAVKPSSDASEPASTNGLPGTPKSLPPKDEVNSATQSGSMAGTGPEPDATPAKSGASSNTPASGSATHNVIPSVGPSAVDGSRGNLARFDEAWNYVHQVPADYASALPLLLSNIRENPNATDADYDYGWAMVCCAHLRDWNKVWELYRHMRENYSGLLTQGANDLRRNWEGKMEEVKNLAFADGGTAAKNTWRKMQRFDEQILGEDVKDPPSETDADCR